MTTLMLCLILTVLTRYFGEIEIKKIKVKLIELYESIEVKPTGKNIRRYKRYYTQYVLVNISILLINLLTLVLVFTTL